MTTLPETEAIITELTEGWLTIWFNTPENRNALSDQLVRELLSTLNAIRNDRSVRGVTLRGKGGVFCAGGDLKAFKAGLQEGGKRCDIVKMNREGGEMFALVSTMPQTLVVLVEGAAIAGGLGLACCADIVAVTREAKFSLTETQLGITPAQIAPYVVARIGAPAAKRLMLTGARFDGEEAARLGFADHVAEDAADLDAIEGKIRAAVKRCAPGANAATKEIILATQRLDREKMMDFAAEKFADCLMSEEGREGISAFVQKRKPKWAQ